MSSSRQTSKDTLQGGIVHNMNFTGTLLALVLHRLNMIIALDQGSTLSFSGVLKVSCFIYLLDILKPKVKEGCYHRAEVNVKSNTKQKGKRHLYNRQSKSQKHYNLYSY